MNKKEYEVKVPFQEFGTIFEFEGRNYIVVKQTKDGCTCCKLRKSICDHNGHEFSCIASDRSDNVCVRYDLYFKPKEEKQ